MRTDKIIEALQALALLLEQEPYLPDVEQEAIIRAVFAAILDPRLRVAFNGSLHA